MNDEQKKAAIASYKKRESAVGIYAVYCAISAQIWVGQSPNLETIQNRLWFTLRLGSNTHPDLQNAWRQHGTDAFSFEVLERLEDDDLAFARNALLKKRLDHWQAKLGAQTI